MSTTVAVSKETKEMLRKLDEKGESYDSIIHTLIEEVSWKRLDDRWNKILKKEEFIPLEVKWSIQVIMLNRMILDSYRTNPSPLRWSWD
jgi:hypothetical protein